MNRRPSLTFENCGSILEAENRLRKFAEDIFRDNIRSWQTNVLLDEDADIDDLTAELDLQERQIRGQVDAVLQVFRRIVADLRLKPSTPVDQKPAIQ